MRSKHSWATSEVHPFVGRCRWRRRSQVLNCGIQEQGELTGESKVMAANNSDVSVVVGQTSIAQGETQGLTFRFSNFFRTSQKFANFEKSTKFRRNISKISDRFMVWRSNYFQKIKCRLLESNTKPHNQLHESSTNRVEAITCLYHGLQRFVV